MSARDDVAQYADLGIEGDWGCGNAHVAVFCSLNSEADWSAVYVGGTLRQTLTLDAYPDAMRAAVAYHLGEVASLVCDGPGTPHAGYIGQGAVCADCGAGDCPWTSVDECAMVAERSVAGTDAPIPGCAVHGR